MCQILNWNRCVEYVQLFLGYRTFTELTETVKSRVFIRSTFIFLHMEYTVFNMAFILQDCKISALFTQRIPGVVRRDEARRCRAIVLLLLLFFTQWTPDLLLPAFPGAKARLWRCSHGSPGHNWGHCPQSGCFHRKEVVWFFCRRHQTHPSWSHPPVERWQMPSQGLLPRLSFTTLKSCPHLCLCSRSLDTCLPQGALFLQFSPPKVTYFYKPLYHVCLPYLKLPPSLPAWCHLSPLKSFFKACLCMRPWAWPLTWQSLLKMKP